MCTLTVSHSPSPSSAHFLLPCTRPDAACNFNNIIIIIVFFLSVFHFSYSVDVVGAVAALLPLPSIHWKRHKLLFAFLFLFPMSTQYFTYGRPRRALNQNSFYQIKVIQILLLLFFWLLLRPFVLVGVCVCVLPSFSRHFDFMTFWFIVYAYGIRHTLQIRIFYAHSGPGPPMRREGERKNIYI